MVAEQEYVGPPLVGVDSSWKIQSLESICDGVFDCPHSTPMLVDEGIFMVRTQDIRKGYFDTSNAVFVSQETYKERIKRAEPSPGDILFSREGTYFGDAAEIPERTKVCLGQRMVLIRPKSEIINPSFLRNWINSPTFQNYLLAFRDGTVTERLNMSTVRTLPIPLPPLPEQKAIAHILGSLDDKIEVNRKMNATLEAMAQALFKSWFVDFDPVIDNALTAGNPIPPEFQARAELRRLNAEKLESATHHSSLATQNSRTAHLFPDSFQETEELGWIPQGWETGKITELADLNSESWSNKTHPDHVNYVDLANTKNGRINEVFPYDYSEAPSRARRVLKVDDTIIGTVRPGNRSFAYIQEDGLTGSTGFAVLRPKQEACRSYVYLCLTQDDVIDHFAHLADGGAYSAIRPEVVGNLETVTFPQELMELFDQKAYPLIEKIGQHQRATDILTNLRDTLLPKLISGDLRIPNKEHVSSI
ncbi:restriction endonuclease subunit S [Coraliomargarita sp. SDUM461003]|uniref:Restriction endonuclease subunit S n=1 Tax=Thalassobacterium maritimum TaxID=3041265 RepID=A0ABU1AYY6_9BACT|nr:restriction endonuclease subunit S [Coraliomargarita sp. SDUM461003]MDQ8209371.1 restriction endonuclease subunit S [Coraliomargarita sp. SDUM461003]